MTDREVSILNLRLKIKMYSRSLSKIYLIITRLVVTFLTGINHLFANESLQF